MGQRGRRAAAGGGGGGGVHGPAPKAQTQSVYGGMSPLLTRALFGSAQPKSRLHTSHLNDIIHAPHQSRAASNLDQPTYCKIFCVRR